MSEPLGAPKTVCSLKIQIGIGYILQEIKILIVKTNLEHYREGPKFRTDNGIINL